MLGQRLEQQLAFAVEGIIFVRHTTDMRGSTRRKIIAIQLLVACVYALVPFSLSAAVQVPQPVPGVPLYAQGANEFAAAIVVDARTGKELYAYKPDLVWTAASLTKLMTALVVMDHHQSWQKIVALSAADEVGGGRLRVNSGSTLSIQDLFYSSIVGSANNTTMALARLSGLGVKKFVTQMNVKAAALGLQNTKFFDPSGMDPRNHTTARDMALLSQSAFGIPLIRKAATTSRYRFVIRNTAQVKTITNTNKLLTEDPDMYVRGGKTGFLYESQYNLAVEMRPMRASLATPPLVVVVLGAPTKDGSFASAKALAQWAWKAYHWPSSQLTSSTP